LIPTNIFGNNQTISLPAKGGNRILRCTAGRSRSNLEQDWSIRIDASIRLSKADLLDRSEYSFGLRKEIEKHGFFHPTIKVLKASATTILAFHDSCQEENKATTTAETLS
jgi:hypothetical protein